MAIGVFRAEILSVTPYYFSLMVVPAKITNYR